MIAVSGVRINGTFASAPDAICPNASLHGPHVDLAGAFSGPTTEGNNGYGVYCGTSLAAAQVSAAAVLVRVENPSWSQSQVRDHLKSTAAPATPAAHFGSGILDAGTALGVPLPPPPPPLDIEITGPDLIEPSATCSWSAIAHDGTPPFSYFWQGDVVPKWITTQQYTGSKDPSHPGTTFKVKVSVTDADGRTGEDELLVTESVAAPTCLI